MAAIDEIAAQGAALMRDFDAECELMSALLDDERAPRAQALLLEVQQCRARLNAEFEALIQSGQCKLVAEPKEFSAEALERMAAALRAG